MKSANEKIEFIKNLIKHRVRIRLFAGDIELYDVDLLPSIMVWGSPEGTIYSCYETHLINSKKGISEIQTIEDLDVFASDGFPKVLTLPNNINDYLKLRLRREFPMIAHLYTDNLLQFYKDIIAKEIGYDPNSILKQAIPTTSSVTNKSKEGCYIATVCYGDYNSKEVKTFRIYRDRVLSNSILGRQFINFYYFISPTISRYLGKNKRLNGIVKTHFLDKIYNKISQNYE